MLGFSTEGRCRSGWSLQQDKPWKGLKIAPGDRNTLAAVQDPVRRPAFPRDPLPEDLLTGVPERLFELDKGMFSKNLRSARRGAAAGPSGMTVEHLQPLLDHPSALHSMYLLESGWPEQTFHRRLWMPSGKEESQPSGSLVEG